MPSYAQSPSRWSSTTFGQPRYDTQDVNSHPSALQSHRIHALKAKALLSGSGMERGFGSVFRHQYPKANPYRLAFFLACSPRVGACSRRDLADAAFALGPPSPLSASLFSVFRSVSVEDSGDQYVLHQGLSGAGCTRPLPSGGDREVVRPQKSRPKVAAMW